MRTSTPGLADDVARDSRGAAVRAERPQQAHAGVHPEQMDDMRLLPENDGEVGAPQPGRPWTYEGGHGTVGKSWAGWAGSRERDYKTNRHAGGGVRMGEGTWPVFRLGRLHPQQPGRARTRWLPRNHRTTRLTRKTTFFAGTLDSCWCSVGSSTRRVRIGGAGGVAWRAVGATIMEPVLGEPRDLGGGEGSEARHHRSQLPHGVARHALTRRGCITNVSCATCLVSEHAGKLSAACVPSSPCGGRLGRV